jgi:hypothetical protein
MIFDHQPLWRVISSAQLHTHGRATDGAILPTTLRVRLVTVAGIGGSYRPVDADHPAFDASRDKGSALVGTNGTPARST